MIRVTPDIAELIQLKQKKGQSVPDVLRELIFPPVETYYVLPSNLNPTPELARGEAIMKSVRTKSKPEKPVKVLVK